MNTPKTNSSSRTWIGIAACVVVGGLVGAFSYWHDQKAEPKAAVAPQTGTLRQIPKTPIPADATPQLKEFLENQNLLAEKMELDRSQSPHGILTPELFAQFRQKNDQLLARQTELSKIIAEQQNQGVSAPPSLQASSKAPAKTQDYLKLRDDIMRDQIAFMNQHKDDALPARQIAMQKWRQQNAGRLQDLQKLAQTLPPPTAPR